MTEKSNNNSTGSAPATLSQELAAGAFRSLIAHLQQRTDVQNIDLMELAGFCRNCMARWLVETATRQGQDLSIADAKRMVYGMEYQEWKSKFQTGEPATFTERH